ncbi:hypothetical protein TRIP_D450082 [uncultured Paludibacter sp.]|nr:hypothetical protein TRIP_D450082 [uncultured Paludibacter sp.]
MNNYNNETLNRLLSEITPEEQAKTDAKMLLAVKIADAMKAKGWNNTQLMKETGKTNPSEITRWLSGTQNFTVETLVDLERVLGIKLLNLEEDRPEVQTIENIQLTLIVPIVKKQVSTTSLVSEPENTQTYFSQTYYS